MLSRRTLAGLAAGAGLGFFLAGVTIAGWWFLDARHQPAQVRSPDNIEIALQQAAAVELHAGQRPVYIIGPRADAAWEHWAVVEGDHLAGLGRSVRAVVVPSGSGGAAEEATVAQLWLNPEARLLKQWLERNADLWTGAGLPSLRNDPLRQQSLAKAAAFARLTERETGTKDRWPVVFWHDPTGDLVVCVCDTPQAQTRARKILGLTGKDETVVSAVQQTQSVDAETINPVSMPYPQGQPLPDAGALSIEAMNEPAGEVYPPAISSPSPRLPGDIVPEAVRPVRAVAPSMTPAVPASRPRTKVVNTAPPEAKKEAESLFF